MREKTKTRKSAFKRFCATGRHKLLQRKAAKSHLLQKKTTKRKKRLSRVNVTHNRDIKNVFLMLPFLKKF